MNAIDTLRDLSVKLMANFKETADGASFVIDNDQGSGKAKAVQLFPGLEVLTCDLILDHQIEMDGLSSGANSLHFIFLSEGTLEHCFERSDDKEILVRYQNVIVGSNKDGCSNLTLPKDTKIKFVIITISEISIQRDYKRRGLLPFLLSDVLQNLSKDSRYAYFGNISDEASEYVNTIIDITLGGLSNRLLLEASTLKTLSCQFLDHKSNHKSAIDNQGLTKLEIIGIVKLSEYISNNLNERLSLQHLERYSGINQKRIQHGIKYFFGESVNKFITSLRILQAKTLLETTELSVSEIVYKIGLNSRSYFARIFSEKYGLLPNEYRKYHHLSNPTYELSYFSKAKNGLARRDFKRIVDTANTMNKQFNITGCLIYHRGYFFQILEGPKKHIQTLYKNIKGDTRHVDVTLVYKGVKSGKTFDEWSMAFIEEPSTFSETKIENARVLNIDMLFLGDKSNSIKTRLMWEKARNLLLVEEARSARSKTTY
jgi:AraC-like DNA-binding protein